MEIKVNFGCRLKEIRLKKNITQELLSEKTGIDRTFISHIEGGSRNVSLETIHKLLIGLEIDFKKFFNSDYFIT